MTDSKPSEVKIDGRTGHEIVGSIDVVRIDHEDGAPRPYHLELDMSDEMAAEFLKYGSEVTSQLDLLNSGMRAALIERLSRLQEEAKAS
jgi:hypothetical protein